MPRTPSAIPNRQIHTTLPPDLLRQVEAHLGIPPGTPFPHGAFQSFLVGLLRSHFEDQTLDLAPYLDTRAGEVIVKGSAVSISRLILHLRQCRLPPNAK